MTRIVREHYPVEKLPEDLRDGLPVGTTVTVTVEGRSPPAPFDSRLDQILRDARPVGPSEARMRLARSGVGAAEAVARIRALRDEWDS